MDNRQRKKPEDSSRISLAEEWGVRHSMKELKVSEQVLRDAVETSGHGADAVRWHLQQMKQRRSLPARLRAVDQARGSEACKVIQQVPDEHNSADEIMAEWLRLYEHSEAARQRLTELARRLSEHIDEVIEERRQWKPPEPSSS
ncbi:MAG: DUF3606 domain-containing protein [Planctomycetaceae bacterium]|nr:DUF3606 domain-containing protein [Planctomycetaceae bacterium]